MKEEKKEFGFGINIVGYATGEHGVGEGMRATIRAIEETDIPFVINNITVPWHRNLDNTYTNFSEDNPYPINLVHINPNLKLFQRLGNQFFKNKYNIGFWVWEVADFPSQWKFAFDIFDEIWTYSNHSLEAISAVSPIPVLKVMPSLALSEPSFDEKLIKLPEDKFIFLFMFDFHSILKRKNPYGVIRAFQEAFSNSNKNVLLVIKSSNSKHFPQERDYIKSLIETSPSILFMDGLLSKREVNYLIYNCHCYVSMHRAEGFGLTMAEAMYYEKPVIATGYSSNVDFMNVGNSFLVKYDIVKTTEDYGPYLKGSIWAEPDIYHAASIMKHVFDNYEEAKEIGERASQEIKYLLDPKFVGKRIGRRLEYIMKKIKPSTSLNQIQRNQMEKNWRRSQFQAWKQTAQTLQNELEKCHQANS